MAEQRPTLGLVLHSNFARHYAAARRENNLGHAERTMEHMEYAAELQQAHWGGVQAHLAARDERYMV